MTAVSEIAAGDYDYWDIKDKISQVIIGALIPGNQLDAGDEAVRILRQIPLTKFSLPAGGFFAEPDQKLLRKQAAMRYHWIELYLIPVLKRLRIKVECNLFAGI